MSYKYGLKFGSGDSRLFSGLTPTFVIFVTEGGTTMSSPSISEVGSSTGLYYFTYTPSATFTIFFEADGGPQVTDNNLRYISGTLDPISTVDRSVGFVSDSYGSTLGASTVFGMVNRINEIWAADSTFNKTTGVWQQFAKGTSTLLYSKTLVNGTGQVTKL